MVFKIGDYVSYRIASHISNEWKGKIIDIKEENSWNYRLYIVKYKSGIIGYELEQDLEKIDWLLEEL
jgi:hypothetical protein